MKTNLEQGEFGHFIATERKKKWLTRKDFFDQANLSCSYGRYTVIEKGKTPWASLNLAIEILSKLDADESLGLHCWVRDCMPSPQQKAYFIDLSEDQYSSRPASLNIEDDEKKYFFEKSPLYKEISVYISMYDYRGVKFNELLREFAIDRRDLQLKLKHLQLIGLIYSKDEHFYVPGGSWLRTPNTVGFRKAVSIVFSDTVNSHFSSEYSESNTIEHSAMRLATLDQIEQLRARIRVLSRWFSLLPDCRNGIPYRIFFGGNRAVFGSNKEKYIDRS